MTLTSLILATTTAICPAAGPQDSYPVALLASCPAPVTGLLYPLDHEDQDARLVRSALGAARAGEECAARLDEATETRSPTWLYVAGALVVGGALGYLAATADVM